MVFLLLFWFQHAFASYFSVNEINLKICFDNMLLKCQFVVFINVQVGQNQLQNKKMQIMSRQTGMEMQNFHFLSKKSHDVSPCTVWDNIIFFMSFPIFLLLLFFFLFFSFHSWFFFPYIFKSLFHSSFPYFKVCYSLLFLSFLFLNMINTQCHTKHRKT